jgi:hypothetical protein
MIRVTKRESSMESRTQEITQGVQSAATKAVGPSVKANSRLIPTGSKRLTTIRELMIAAESSAVEYS